MNERIDERRGLRKGDGRMLLAFARFLGPHVGWVILSFAVLCGAFLVDLLAPFVIRATLDGPVAAVLREERRFDPGLRSELLLKASLFLLLSFGGAALRYFEVVVFGWVGQRVSFDIRQSLFAHLLRLPMRFFDRHAVGELVVRTTNDVDNLVEFFASGVAAFLFDLLRIVGVLTILFWDEPRIAAIVVLLLPLFAVITFRFRNKAREAYGETRTALARANAFAQESLSGMKVTQLLNQERQMERRFCDLGETLLKAWQRTVGQFALLFSMVDFLSQAILILSFASAAWLIAGAQMSIGQWTQYWFYLHFLLGPIRELAERYNILQSALSSAEKISRILAEPLEEGGAFTAPLKGAIEFDEVVQSYDGAPPALRSLSLSIQPGETVAVVGATGAGKTTLSSLVLGLYRCQQGSVRIDGIDVKDWSIADLRRGIGVVPQEVFLFATSILENVRLGDPSIPEETVREALSRVGAGDLIARLPNGVHTVLGERGVNLSAGERQLVAFARVLVHQPRILILDEATSSVDTHTEECLQRAVETVLRGRTCIVIAHRLSTVRSADRILVLHKGELREQGTHHELYARNGIYTRLHDLQFQGSET